MKTFSQYLDITVERLFSVFLPVGIIVYYAVENLKEFIYEDNTAIAEYLVGQCGVLS